MTGSRRGLRVLGGIVPLIYGLRAPPWDRIPGGGPCYVVLPELRSFRRLGDQGQGPGETAAFVGLDATPYDADQRRARAGTLRAGLCPALFGPALPTQTVPIAYSSEVRCPCCRALERDLDTPLAADIESFRCNHHAPPTFRPSSELAARASVAAACQGKQQELRRHLMRTSLVAEPASILRDAFGLNVDRLVHDMTSPEVQADLDQTRVLEDAFGSIGTPGLVTGRTAFNDAIPYALLRRKAKYKKSRLAPVC